MDISGDRAGFGATGADSLTTFHEIPGIGERWTLVGAYGDWEVHGELLPRTALAASNWTITIPAKRHQHARASGVPVEPGGQNSDLINGGPGDDTLVGDLPAHRRPDSCRRPHFDTSMGAGGTGPGV